MRKEILLKLSVFYTAVLLSCSIATSVWAQECWVVVNKNNPIAALSKQEVNAIFLGVRRMFNNIHEIEVVDQAIENPIYAEFYQAVTGKTVAQVRAKRAALTFTDDVLPPDAVFDDKAVVAWIEQHPHGIGYVYANSDETIGKRVKVVYRFSVNDENERHD